MKLSKALEFAKSSFQKNGIENSSLDALILLKSATSFSREKIIFNPDLLLSDEQLESFLSLVERRCRKEPVSHLINNREFFGLDFIVNKNVLDPRADSETLVECVIKKHQEKFLDRKINILEIGAGSGCLTISVLKNIENSCALMVDISKEALLVCKQNVDKHGLKDRIELVESDLFAKIPKKKFDIIISNPPYIRSHEIEELQDEVKIYEPRQALDGGADGLYFYREIANKAKNFLEDSGLIFLEIGFDQKQDVEEIFKENGFTFNDARKDLAGRDRVLCFSLI